MQYGVSIFFTDYSMSPTQMACELEARGFESLWAPEHTHIPSTRNSDYPQGGELPRRYYEVMDPFVTLSAAAAVTTRLRIGTGICLVVQRDPIQTAKSVASLDRISAGRFLFGIGAGWNQDEMANHGTRDFKGRFKLMEERVRAMRVIWTQAEPEFHGDHVDFGPMMTWPKPLQDPLPVIVGGMFPHGARRAIAFGDGWMPHANRPQYGERDILAYLPAFRDMVQAAGREPGDVPVTTFGTPVDADTLARYRDAGIHRVVFSIGSDGRDGTLATLDRLDAVIGRVR